MKTEFILQAVDAISIAIHAHESEIESLDRAIGDGDHFINIKRGVTTIAAMREELSALPADVALQRIGMKLLSTIGGASGPLFASFFIAMSKTLKTQQEESLATIAAAFADGVESIKQRGKSDLGEKTMLDVLIPVAQTFRQQVEAGADMPALLTAIKASAEQGMLSTRDMLATKGRAAFLGERAIGHIDAGAKSSQVMISAVCDLLAQT
ncbi:MAG: dihydroxyacetone kinase subunit L [Betaproteobacteria bacterium HGW-Betaproteobacteria-1]|jgi:dihydroxyacetone kinase-like protein|nr:MAG: dihydroxyacetone kinase subunit L [Betaproteobacteria bacterium HGW-Betaproteobacteria-1]